MPRPKLCRKLMFKPEVTYFKPAGVPMNELEEIILDPDEIEALKLSDAEGLKQEDCAKKMQISQPTLNRALTSARKKVAEALIKGKALRIEVKQ